jgi:hypothetical protein
MRDDCLTFKPPVLPRKKPVARRPQWSPKSIGQCANEEE